MAQKMSEVGQEERSEGFRGEVGFQKFMEFKVETSETKKLIRNCVVWFAVFTTIFASGSSGVLMIPDAHWHNQLVFSTVMLAICALVLIGAQMLAEWCVSEGKELRWTHYVGIAVSLACVVLGMLTMANLLLSSIDKNMFEILEDELGKDEDVLMAYFIMSATITLEILIPLTIIRATRFVTVSEYFDSKQLDAEYELENTKTKNSIRSLEQRGEILSVKNAKKLAIEQMTSIDEITTFATDRGLDPREWIEKAGISVKMLGKN